MSTRFPIKDSQMCSCQPLKRLAELATYWEERAYKMEAENQCLREYKQALDDALVVSLQTPVDSYDDPKKALHDLICWEIDVDRYFRDNTDYFKDKLEEE